MSEPALPYTADAFGYRRRPTRVVRIGDVPVGGDHPIVVQSMTTPDPSDIEANVEQALRLVDAGCAIVRVTTPTVKDAEDLGRIRDALRARGCDVPLVADIHFNPQAALRAADFADKVRVNPGNYTDSRKFAVREYTDAEYDAELRRLEERFAPLVEKCRDLGRAMRVGTNHGSLSDRIMNRYGDSPEGMVESALEFVRIAERMDYRDVVLSMKASNVRVMVAAYRLLAVRLAEEGLDHPFHLGVTEAGGGRDGRVKSAAGIGALLADGIGDTIRVSLTEDPVREIPVALALAAPFTGAGGPTGAAAGAPGLATAALREARDPFDPRRRATARVVVGDLALGGDEPCRAGLDLPIGTAPPARAPGEPPVEIVRLAGDLPRLTVATPEAVREAVAAVAAARAAGNAAALVVDAAVAGRALPRAAAAALDAAGLDAPLVLLHRAGAGDLDVARDVGGALVDGLGDAVVLDAGVAGAADAVDLAYTVLQATRTRLTRTDYIACPGCGRTLFDLEETTERIRARTGHLDGLKIAVMGCIVNGPGEMADADFGYVGSAPGKVNLFVGKECIERNVPSAEADERLVTLIKEHGRWVDPVGSQRRPGRGGPAA